MALLYANENFPIQVVECLRKFGHDVLTSHEAGNANQRIPDKEVLVYSTNQGRALLTLNRHDFIKLHNQYPNHAGIIVCTQDKDIQVQAKRLHQAISSYKSLEGELVRVYHPSEE